MLPPNRSKPATHFLSGLLLLLGGACSTGADRATPADTAPSGSTGGTVADTVPAPADTTPVASQSATVAQSTTTTKPPIKPSIDPGRKTTPPVRVPAPAPAPAATPKSTAASQDQWLKYDPGTNTVTFELIGGPNGFQFNGYASGGATLTLPPRANVVMNFVNKDGTPHSAEVIAGEGALPNAGGDAAIPRAYTNQLLQGLPQEGSDAIRFQAPDQGTYRIFCGVPGHGLSGMWIWMKVDPAAKAPGFGPTKS